MSIAADADWRCWFLLSRLPLEAVAERVGTAPAEVEAAALRVAAEIVEVEAAARARSLARPPRLIPNFGNSGKPLSTMTCADVHPCAECRGDGCDACNHTGARSLEGDRSPFFCPICYGSGWDYLEALKPSPLPDPEPTTTDGLLGGKS